MSTLGRAIAACSIDLISGVLLAAALGCLSSVSQEPVEANGGERGLNAYRIVWERNIFDPDRRAASAGEPVRAEAPPPPKRLQLVGVGLSEGEARAFFEGTEHGFDTDVRVGDEIGGFKVEAIGIDGAALAHDDERLAVRVGGGLVSEVDGAWSAVESLAVESAPGLSPGLAEPPGGAPQNNAKSDAKPSGAAASLLEQLKERRKQELQK